MLRFSAAVYRVMGTKYFFCAFAPPVEVHRHQLLDFCFYNRWVRPEAGFLLQQIPSPDGCVSRAIRLSAGNLFAVYHENNNRGGSRIFLIKFDPRTLQVVRKGKWERYALFAYVQPWSMAVNRDFVAVMSGTYLSLWNKETLEVVLEKDMGGLVDFGSHGTRPVPLHMGSKVLVAADNRIRAWRLPHLREFTKIVGDEVQFFHHSLSVRSDRLYFVVREGASSAIHCWDLLSLTHLLKVRFTVVPYVLCPLPLVPVPCCPGTFVSCFLSLVPCPFPCPSTLALLQVFRLLSLDLVPCPVALVLVFVPRSRVSFLLICTHVLRSVRFPANREAWPCRSANHWSLPVVPAPFNSST